MASLASPFLTNATIVLPVSLETMTAQANLIINGLVTSQEVKRDEGGRVATFTTFDVIEVIKGRAGDTVTIKQIGGRVSDSDIEIRSIGVPRFVIGQEYIVFLPTESVLGFRSPIGLQQGRFFVREDINGPTVSQLPARATQRTTPIKNATLLDQVDTKTSGQSELGKRAFIDNVKGLLLP